MLSMIAFTLSASNAVLSKGTTFSADADAPAEISPSIWITAVVSLFGSLAQPNCFATENT